MASHFALKKAANGQFMFNLVAGNNEIVLTSETYSSKAAAEAGIASVKHNAPQDANYERKKASDNSPFFVLKSANNGQMIGRSEMYSAAAAMEKGIKAVMTAAVSATTKET